MIVFICPLALSRAVNSLCVGLGGAMVVLRTGLKAKEFDSFADLALEHVELDFWVCRSRRRSNDHHRGHTGRRVPLDL
jgi:hypothetical protein